MENGHEEILRLEGITKHFPGVVALDNVSFDLRKGEVHVLLGENGAGKSTLIKIISGAYPKDTGDVFLNGERIQILGPRHAMELGISTVYQEFTLIPHLSVAENIFLGRQPTRGPVIPRIDRSKMNRDSRELLHHLSIDIDPRVLVSRLGVAYKQMVEIAKVFAVKTKICIFDEPTATLTSEETLRLFELIQKFKSEGIGIIYISHRLEEVFKVADRITVMRNGKCVGTKNRDDVTAGQLVEMMIGRKIEESILHGDREIGAEVLKVDSLSGRKLRNISLSVRAGEIIGLAGLVGSGRTELLRAIFGADRFDSGSVIIEGKRVRFKRPMDAVRQKIALLPEDRKKHGLLLCRPVAENVIISSLDSVSVGGLLNNSKIFARVREFIEKLQIKTPSQKQPVMYLSGGNQQKVIIARWLSADSKLIMFDEPTRGIDVGAKHEVYHLIHNMAQSGKGVLLVSSQIPELLQICDRIYVMHEGKIAAEYQNKGLSSDRILNAAFGRTDSEETA
jgi:ribose transport system ATP-binding protein